MSPFGHVPDGTPSSGLIISASTDAWGGSAIETNASLGSPDYRKYTLDFAAANQAFTLEYFLQIISSTGDGDGYTEGRQEVLRLYAPSQAAGFAHTANCAIHSTAHHLFTTPTSQSCAHATFGISSKTSRVHVAYQRYENAGTQLFLNGRYVAENGTLTGAITALAVGGQGTTSRNARVWIDGLRFMRGQAMYPARVLEAQGDVVFTVPTTPFEPDE
jgi:hypothetical protein